MTPLELLNSYKTKLTNAINLPEAPPTSLNKIRQAQRNTPADIRIKRSVYGEATPRGGGKFQVRGGSITPRVPGTKVQPLVNTNPTGLKPKPNYPGPAGNLRGLRGGGLRGGLVTAAAGVVGDAVIPHIARSAVRGALVVTGQDTSGYDRRLAGLPNVKNFGGVSYNISTPEGLAGALKAKEKGKKVSVPTRPGTPPVDPGTPLITIATGLDTGSGSREARLDPNATERYASNFKAGQANMSDIQEMYADRKDLQEWAKANPALAQKEFAKSGFQSIRMKNADIQDQMDDTGRSRDDIIAINNGGLETVIDGSSIGKSTPQDAQAFKNAAAQLVAKGQLPSSMNAGSTPIIPGVTPMIEGIELSTAVKPDYKAEMEDGVMNQLAKGLDIPTKRFASQGLKDVFMNNILGK